jgi:hypothetical protein
MAPDRLPGAVVACLNDESGATWLPSGLLIRAESRLCLRRCPHAELEASRPFNGLEQRTYDPSALLERYVECFWTLRSREDGLFTLKLFANGVSGIMVQHHDGRSALSRTGSSPGASGIPSAFVYGKRTQPGELVARGPFEMIGVVLRPQALHALLDTDPAGFNNGPVSIDDLFDGLEDPLLNAGTARERLALLDRCLSARVIDQPSDDALACESARLLRTPVRFCRHLLRSIPRGRQPARCGAGPTRLAKLGNTLADPACVRAVITPPCWSGPQSPLLLILFI